MYATSLALAAAFPYLALHLYLGSVEVEQQVFYRGPLLLRHHWLHIQIQGCHLRSLCIRSVPLMPDLVFAGILQGLERCRMAFEAICIFPAECQM